MQQKQNKKTNKKTLLFFIFYIYIFLLYSSCLSLLVFIIVVSAVAWSRDSVDGIRKTRNTLTLISCPSLLLLLAFPIAAASHLFLWLVVTRSNPIACRRSNKKQTKQNKTTSCLSIACTYAPSVWNSLPASLTNLPHCRKSNPSSRRSCLDGPFRRL